jgi:hypothetical protein
VLVGRRVLPALLALLAAVADSTGGHALAFDALLGAVPFAAVSALVAFGEQLDRRDAVASMQAVLWGFAVVLLVLSCAVRSGASPGVPPLAESALVATLLVFGAKAVLALAPFLRRLALRPAKP